MCEYRCVHLFIVDETNRDYVADHFFIVGGLVFTEPQVELIDAAVREVRSKYGYLPGDSLKFDTNTRPSQVTIAQAATAKAELITKLHVAGARLIVYVVLHDLCKTQSYDVRMNFALNTLTYAYFTLLKEETATGIMLMDRDNDRFEHLETLFQHGLDISGSKVGVDGKIRLFGMTNDNASNLSSAADVAIGAFRYCVNTAGGWGKDTVAKQMFPTLAKIMWGVERQGVKHVGGYGYHARPKQVRVPRYQNLYSNLIESLKLYAEAAD